MTEQTPHTHSATHAQAAKSTTKSIVLGFAIFGVILALIIWAIVALAGSLGGDRKEILKNGVSVQGTSDGTVFQGIKKTGRGGSVTKTYQARYDYTDSDGRRRSVIGEKNYGSPEGARAGMKATVTYLPDDPEKAEVTDEE